MFGPSKYLRDTTVQTGTRPSKKICSPDYFVLKIDKNGTDGKDCCALFSLTPECSGQG